MPRRPWLIPLALMLASSARPATLRVPSEFPAIQTAVDSAAALDTVLVAPGTYTDGPPCVRFDRPVVLLSESGSAVTTIDAQGAGGVLQNNSGVPGLVVDGFTLQGGTGFGSAVLLEWPGTGQATVRDCLFQGNAGTLIAWDFNGNYYRHEFSHCTFTGNSGTIVQAFGNIDFLSNVVVGNTGTTVLSLGIEGFVPLVADCLIANNAGTAIYAASIIESVFVVRRTTIAGNAQPEVVAMDCYSDFEQTIIVGDVNVQTSYWACPLDVTFSHSDLWQGSVTGTPEYVIWAQPNLDADPEFCDPAGGDYAVSASSPCLASRNSWGLQVGAYGQGCGPTSLESLSWGRIKARFR